MICVLLLNSWNFYLCQIILVGMFQQQFTIIFYLINHQTKLIMIYLNWQCNPFKTLLTVNTVQNLKNLLLKIFLEYFQQPSSKKQFLEYYKDCERKLHLQNSAARLEEVEIAGNEFVGDHICEKAEKRKLNDLVADTDTRPLKFQIKSKTYDIQSPQNAAVLDSPVIEESNMNTLKLLEEYRGPQNDHRKNLNLLKVYYSLAFFYQVPRA